MIKKVAAWTVGDRVVSLEAERRPEAYALRWRNAGQSEPQGQQELEASGDEHMELFESCSNALARAMELGVRIAIRPNLDEVCGRRGPPRIDAATGCPSWDPPKNYSAYDWFVYLDTAGKERVWDQRDWILIYRELLEQCDKEAINALRRGLAPVRGIGDRLQFLRQPDPDLEAWYCYLRVSNWYREVMLYDIGCCDSGRYPEIGGLGHADSDPILDYPM